MSGVLPDEMASQLAVLQSSAPPMSYGLVEEVFQRAYGHGPKHVFKEFEHQPFAAASIGQVHRARLHDGARVAVKVQYPGVREAIEHDLANVGFLLGLSGLVARGLDVGPIVSDLKEGIRAELHYLEEAQIAAALLRSLRRPPVHPRPAGLPRTHDRHGARPGAHRGSPVSPPPATFPRRSETASARSSIASLSGVSTATGYSTATRIPGNYLLLEDGGVAFVDYGCVAEFSTSDARCLQGAHPGAAGERPRRMACGD